jgi:hypothetical protein
VNGLNVSALLHAPTKLDVKVQGDKVVSGVPET